MVDLARSIQDLGLAGIIVLIALVAVIGAARQWYVFGWIYRQERDARITAETQAVRNAESLAKSSEAYAELAHAYTDLTKAAAEMRRFVNGEQRRKRPGGPVDDPG